MSTPSRTQQSADQRPPCAGRILVVDDVEDNRALLTRRFRRRGYSVVEAADGNEALRHIAAETFDLVLLDVMMPGMSGLQVLSVLRETHPPAALPVIMATARSEGTDVAQALGAGANDYVTKPIDFPVLLARSQAQIERRRAECALRDANDALRQSNVSLQEANEALRRQVARERTYEDRIDYLAHHDVLTGLANRKRFEQRLRAVSEVTRAPGEPGVAVLLVECEGLRCVREALGHAVADTLVKSIAESLCSGIGPDDLLARVGTAEYALLHASPDQSVTASTLAARLIGLVGDCRTFDGHTFGLQTHIGIAIDEGAHDPAALLQQADLAMHRARAAGSDTYRFFHPEMDGQVRSRRRLEIDLRKAVIEHGFELHYQPIYDVQRECVTTFEALLRWTHPERGPVSPAEFIPLAEAIGVIGALGEWVVRSACAEACRWPADVAVAVNISPEQFKDGGLVRTIRDALTDSGLSPERLQLEITESVMLSDTDVNLETLRELRALGLRIAMDDFGTGYSSLSYLRSFRFDKIKIDKSFIRDMCEEVESRAIVRAVVGLGSSFGVTVTAEGVETAEQLAYLRLEGCTEVQGYLLGRPREADRIPDVIAGRDCAKSAEARAGLAA